MHGLQRSPVAHSTPTVALHARLTSEEDLAKWLGLPNAVIQQWRIQGPCLSPTKYRLGTAYDWIIDHITPVFTSATSTEYNSDNTLDDIVAAWKMKIPVMLVGDTLLGFLRSVKEESQPSGYRLVNIPALPFHPREVTRAALATFKDLLVAHAEFSTAVSESDSKAETIYEQWKNQVQPEVRLQFFRSALLGVLSYILMTRPDGTKITFRSAGEEWIASGDVNGKLRRDPNSARDIWQYINDKNEVETYSGGWYPSQGFYCN